VKKLAKLLEKNYENNLKRKKMIIFGKKQLLVENI